MDPDLSRFEDSQLPRGSRASEFWQGKDIDKMFPEGGSEVQTTPWGQAGRRKDRQDFDPDLVRNAIQSPADDVTDIDPRHLLATQPSVTRGGVQHYMDDPTWRETGETFADKGNPGNRIPVVYSRQNEFRTQDWQPEEEHLLLSGHHRAAAALLQGQQFPARHVRGGYGPER